MLLRILRKSLVKRKTRVAIAIISVVMGATMASALLTVSMQVEEKVGYELTNFGPNLVIFPRTDSIQVSVGDVELGSVTEQKFIEEDDLSKIAEIKYSENVRGIRGIAPYLFSVVKVNDENSLVLAGTWFDEARDINTWWSIDGEWIEDRNDTTSSIIGVSVAEKLGIAPGDYIVVNYNSTEHTEDGNITFIDRDHTFIVKGILTAGSEDDNRIFVNLDVMQNLTTKEDKVSMIQVTAICNKCPTDVIAAEIEALLPYTEAKTVKQVADAQMDLLGKIEYMMIMITIVALLASALGVMTTMTASVVERQKEIGMMKAIGAQDRKVASLFLIEATIIGLIGGIIGFASGAVLAQFIGESTFQSSITPNLIVLPIIIGISIGITIISSALPVRRAIKIEPAEVLRSV
jgi:putative ABC transport system permease protein